MNIETIRDALSYIEITGCTKALHKKTLQYLKDESFILEAPDFAKEESVTLTTPAAEQFVKQARLYKAHIFLIEEKEFSFVKAHSMGKLLYKNQKGTYAYANWKGEAIINYKLVGKFKNGKEKQI